MSRIGKSSNDVYRRVWSLVGKLLFLVIHLIHMQSSECEMHLCVCMHMCMLEVIHLLCVFSVGEWHSEVMRTAKKEIFDQEVNDVARILSC